MVRKERRSAARVPAKLAMEIRIGDAGTQTVESVNVSANGVYFSSPKYIPVMTRLDIALDLSGPGKRGKGGNNVICSGVVVRTEPEEELPGVSEYRIACFFTFIDDSDKDTLESYILQQIDF